jgi:hypothetical protein
MMMGHENSVLKGRTYYFNVKLRHEDIGSFMMFSYKTLWHRETLAEMMYT